MDLFYGVFCPLGLARGVIYPTYGLAEHTVYVCSNGTQRLCVDKIALERDRIVRVLNIDLLLGGQGEADMKGDGREIPVPVIMMGCGRPADSRGLILKVKNHPDEPGAPQCFWMYDLILLLIS